MSVGPGGVPGLDVSPEKRVLVTGAAGFIGRFTLRFLRDLGYRVHAVDRVAPPADCAEQAWWLEADLLDPKAVDGVLEAVRPTHLLHLAWNTTPPEYWETADNLSWAAASLHLLRRFTEVGGTRAVLAGSCAEYDWHYTLAEEDKTPYRPSTLYGTAKSALRQIALRFADGAGVSLAWAHLFFLYGPYEKDARLVPSVVRALLKGEPALCTAGTHIRDFIYVEDAAEALVRILDTEVTGPINVASGRPVPLKTLIETIGLQLGRAHLIDLGARTTPPGEPKELGASITRLTEEVGYTPRHTLDTGTRRTIAWWRDRLGSQETAR